MPDGGSLPGVSLLRLGDHSKNSLRLLQHLTLGPRRQWSHRSTLDQGFVPRMVETVTWFETLCFVLGKLAAVKQVWAEAGGGREARHKLWTLWPPIPSESASSLGLCSSHCDLIAADVTEIHPHGALRQVIHLLVLLQSLEVWRAWYLIRGRLMLPFRGQQLTTIA